MPDIVSFSQELIKTRPPLAEGMMQTVDYVKKNYPQFDIKPVEQIDFKDCWAKFNKWLEQLLATQPLLPEIKSVWFGLFEEVGPSLFFEKHTITLYLSGSKLNPEQDDDWPCDTTYWPKGRYLHLPCLRLIFKKVKNFKDEDNQADIEIILIQASVFLMIINSIAKHSQALLQHQEKIYVGSGYDSGDIYIIGTLDKNGLN